MRPSHAGPAVGLIAQLALLCALAATAGLGAAGWIAGVACAVTMSALLARAIARSRGERLGPASWVTLGRASLTVGAVALIAESFVSDAHVALLVTLVCVALALDLIDGWLARRTGTASELGARFDGEVDAFLILALSVYTASVFGAWVLAIGAARYLFLAAEWRLPWLSAPLPPRRWRKVVTAAQGVVLTVAAAGILSRSLTQALLAGALVALAASFAECVWWLWRHRDAAPVRRREDAAPRRRGPARTAVAIVLTVLALLVVWAALVAPRQPGHFTPGAFARVPLELLVVVAVAVLLPPIPRRLLAGAAGALVGVLVIVKALDFGFFTAFDRPFNPVDDWSHRATAIETLKEAIGGSHADLVLAVVGVLAVAALVVPVLALLRLTRVAAGHRAWALQAAAALAVVWVALRIVGAPAASTSAAALAVDEAQALHDGLQSQKILAAEITHDRFRATPGDRLLTELRGKDVMLLVVESYGRVAVQDSAISRPIDALLDRGTTSLRAAGFSARSAFLTSPTFGGISWLAHSTIHSGIKIDTQRRYNQLVKSNRFTLSRAFKRAGWRTVDSVPTNVRAWPPGKTFYRYDKIYDRRNMGYRGPTFGYAAMPDQYVLQALQRQELAKRNRPPVFAEVDLVSSHVPWTSIPRLVPWQHLGDGSIFKRLPAAQENARDVIFGNPGRARAAYGQSIQYTMSAIISFVRRYGDDDDVLVVFGDHQPATLVTGEDATHDVPISIIAHDPKVLKRIAGWGWQDGLRPSPRAPVWPMESFRDRFLTAFGSSPSS